MTTSSRRRPLGWRLIHLRARWRQPGGSSPSLPRCVTGHWPTSTSAGWRLVFVLISSTFAATWCWSGNSLNESRVVVHAAKQREEENNPPSDPVETLGEKYSESGHNSPGTSYSASVTAHDKPATTGATARLMAELEQEEHILGLLLEYPAVWSDIYGIVADGDFAGTQTRALFQAFAAAVQTSPSLDLHLFLEEFAATPPGDGRACQVAHYHQACRRMRKVSPRLLPNLPTG